ncbi:helix-turn-helix domain-containing protein [Symbiopectobacterium purcellii]|uniref:helix-turn-helix domain-containing protein n=1 Tax=Symbiopectobacterium purcellii TaxID=2871826 RepID=UPI003F85B3FE
MQEKYIKLYKENDMSLKNIGNKLASLMKRDNIDAQTLSDKTGIGIATIKNIRRGVGNPTISTLYTITEYFKISIGDLTEGTTSTTISETKTATMPLIKYNEIERFLSTKTAYIESYTTEVDDTSDDSLFAFEITNSAFSPELERASICIVSTNESANDGDMVLLKIQGYPIALRRAYVGEAGMIFCNISLENEISPVSYTQYEIVGVLLKVIKRLR